MNRRFVVTLLAAAIIAALARKRLPPIRSWPVRRSVLRLEQALRLHGLRPAGLAGGAAAATLQTNWGWGVGSSRLERLDHQFSRNYPGYGPFGGAYRTTPIWPSDTTQFGVYYVRGPW